MNITHLVFIKVANFLDHSILRRTSKNELLDRCKTARKDFFQSFLSFKRQHIFLV